MFAQISAVFLMLLLFSTANAQTIKINKVQGEKEELAFSILQLAMSKIDPDITFQQYNEVLNNTRVASEVAAGNLDVIWSGASPNKDKKLKAVRIPVLKGLLAHRIFIIRKADQVAFSKVNTLSDLTKFNAGQVTSWGDTQVLRNANIPTITTIKYPNLFMMLKGGRFDYFPRAIHEPWVEVRSRQELNLVVDKHLMLIYPYAMYFYLNKSNQALHDKIYKGFEMAIADGSFDELFFNHPMIKDVLDKANLAQRKVIRIDNPFMHADTPYDRKEFWLDIEHL